jgi:hypothetical protein
VGGVVAIEDCASQFFTVNLSSLRDARQIIVRSVNGLTTFELPVLSTVGDSVDVTVCAHLGLVSMPLLRGVPGRLRLTANTTNAFTAAQFSFSLLESVGGGVEVADNLLLVDLVMPSLIEVGPFPGADNDLRIVDNGTGADTDQGISCDEIQTMLNNLTTCPGDFIGIDGLGRTCPLACTD